MLSNNIIYLKEIDHLKKLEAVISNCEVVVDSLFGVGLNRNLDSFYCEIIHIINKSNKEIISIDIPSGLDGNTGIALGNSVKANYTYTFEVLKKGFINYSAFEYLGEVKVLSIGIPTKVKENNSNEVFILEKNEYKHMIKDRQIYGHKGNYGRATIFAGSVGYTGAAYITTEACVKSGAGLVTLVTDNVSQKILSSKLVEAMTINYGENERIIELLKKSNVIVFGPGISNTKEFEEILMWIIKVSKATMVIDAEGINILSRRQDILQEIKGRAVLTPHLGEMSRLISKPIDYIEKNRIDIAKKFAKENKCILLLKGFNTIITNGYEVIVNNSGNSKMASGGMGDCLTGIISAFISQGYEPFEAAKISTYVHGITGEIVGKEKFSVTATDIIENISNHINMIRMS